MAVAKKLNIQFLKWYLATLCAKEKKQIYIYILHTHIYGYILLKQSLDRFLDFWRAPDSTENQGKAVLLKKSNPDDSHVMSIKGNGKRWLQIISIVEMRTPALSKYSNI